ncbi:MAG: gamma-glutamylcyclotransferase family protein [Syntrophobacteraceae bacterium]
MKTLLKIFVYGTLKKGFANHDSFCGGVLRIERARLCGRLFKLMPDIPVMVVPDREILARGTGNVASDLELQGRFESGASAPPPTGAVSVEPDAACKGWKRINGEVLFFDDPETRLPLIDGLEEFRPGGASTYVRVLVRAALADGSLTTAWTYVAGFDTGELDGYEGETWFPGG